MLSAKKFSRHYCFQQRASPRKQAEEIIFDKKIPIKRPQDAHDILGTFKIVSDPSELKKVPRSIAELEVILKKRHHILMEKRVQANPGQYKDRANRAEDSHFVQPDEIRGTLGQGFQRYSQLPEGLPRSSGRTT